MQIGNVLVIGNSGVGKSTLINAVLGKDSAVTGFGTSGTTKELEIYENKEVPFRIIDTVGFEPSFINRYKAISAVKKWSKDSINDGAEGRTIDVIWYCVEGTSSKLFPKAIKDLSRATSMWRTVPVVVVITKSYSVPERKENIKLVKKAFASEKKFKDRLKNIIPVVASTYTINDTAFAPPVGITELIHETNELMPEGIKAAENDLNNFKLYRKRVLSQSLVGVSTISAVTVGALPVPYADAVLLSTMEVGLINGLAKLYEIDKEDEELFKKSIGSVATVSTIGKTTVSALKAIPGIGLGASVIQAIVAGTIVAALGQGSIYIFEKVYKREKDLSDIDWINKVIDEQISNQFTEKVTKITEIVSENKNMKNVNIGKLILEMFSIDIKNQTREKTDV